MTTELRDIREPPPFLRHWNAIAPVASAAIVIVFGAIAYGGARREDDSMQLVAHTDSVMAANQGVLALMGDDESQAEFPGRLHLLRALVADQPVEQARVDAMGRLLAAGGRATMDSARRVGTAIESDEQQLLAAQNDDQDAHERAVKWIVAIGSVIGAGLALLVSLALSRSAASHARLAEEAHALNEELRVSNEQLEERTAEAEEANRTKAQFLANMSHDLRTPLNAIIGYADLLEVGARGPVTSAQVDDLRRIKRGGKHLATLINDVLDFAKIEAGRMSLHIAPVSLKSVLADVEALVAPQVRSAGLNFSWVCEPDLVVRADRDRLDQILLNLVGNAIKFTERDGSVAVVCRADGPVARVAVRDTGRGIPPGQLDAVFVPFVQVDAQRTPNGQKGVGLGLAISRELARAMSGDLTAESTPGEGSIFTLRLELA